MIFYLFLLFFLATIESFFFELIYIVNTHNTYCIYIQGIKK